MSKLIIISAPSGSGKTTIVKYLLEQFPRLAFSVSATSRKMRAGETDGMDYFFITEQQFRERIEEGDLLEWEEVYPGSYYGTLRSEVKRLITACKDVIFDVDVVGGLNIKKEFGNRALAIFVSPPSLSELEQRLIKRQTESPGNIQKRVDKAGHEMIFANKFDYVLVNDDLEKAKKEAVEIVKEFLQ